jgi:hypothetical protein
LFFQIHHAVNAARLTAHFAGVDMLFANVHVARRTTVQLSFDPSFAAHEARQRGVVVLARFQVHLCDSRQVIAVPGEQFFAVFQLLRGEFKTSLPFT